MTLSLSSPPLLQVSQRGLKVVLQREMAPSAVREGVKHLVAHPLQYGGLGFAVKGTVCWGLECKVQGIRFRLQGRNSVAGSIRYGRLPAFWSSFGMLLECDPVSVCVPKKDLLLENWLCSFETLNPKPVNPTH